MEHFDEVEVTIKFYIITNKGKCRHLIKHIKSWMETMLKYYNYEKLEISASTLKE